MKSVEINQIVMIATHVEMPGRRDDSRYHWEVSRVLETGSNGNRKTAKVEYFMKGKRLEKTTYISSLRNFKFYHLVNRDNYIAFANHSMTVKEINKYFNDSSNREELTAMESVKRFYNNNQNNEYINAETHKYIKQLLEA